MISSLILVGFILFFLWGNWQSNRWLQANKSPGLFYQSWINFARNFRGYNLMAFILSVLITYLIAASGWDQEIQIWFQSNNPMGTVLPWIILIGGNFWPIGFALIPYFLGKRKKDLIVKGGGLAAIHAIFLNAFINTTEKILSGRQGPDNFIGPPHPSHSQFSHTHDPLNFRFDFWNHNLSDGRFMWPSGHTASMFAVVTALTLYFPKKKWIPWIGYPASILTAIAMVDGDFHWFSDVIAGAILGTVVGRVSAKSFLLFFKSD